MLVPTTIGTAEAKLFLIDSGAMWSSISPEAAKEITTLGYELGLEVVGLSGKKSASRAQRAVLRFGHISQENINMLSIDKSDLSRATGIEISGFLGFTALGMMQMDIYYRDGLVNFNYDPKKYRPVLQWKPPTAGR